MIIVSQDKETIVNFNNISIITQVDGRIGVTNNVTNSTVSEIGRYATEERAKEVLQEIVQSIIINRIVENDNPLKISITASNTYFEMPEE